MAPSPPHGSGTRGRDGDSVSLRIRRTAIGACLRRLLLSLGRRNDLPRQDARGLGRCVGLGEPIYDRAEPAGLPLHVLDRPRSPGGGHALAADPSVSPGAGPGSSRADGGGGALHLSLHPGPRGAHPRAFLFRVLSGAWSPDLCARRARVVGPRLLSRLRFQRPTSFIPIWLSSVTPRSNGGRSTPRTPWRRRRSACSWRWRRSCCWPWPACQVPFGDGAAKTCSSSPGSFFSRRSFTCRIRPVICDDVSSTACTCRPPCWPPAARTTRSCPG